MRLHIALAAFAAAFGVAAACAAVTTVKQVRTDTSSETEPWFPVLMWEPSLLLCVALN